MWRWLLQIGALNLQAMLLALVACWVPPVKHLNSRKPPIGACFRANLILLAAAAVGLPIIQIGTMRFLCTRAWYSGGTGSSSKVGSRISKCDIA